MFDPRILTIHIFPMNCLEHGVLFNIFRQRKQIRGGQDVKIRNARIIKSRSQRANSVLVLGSKRNNSRAGTGSTGNEWVSFRARGSY